MENCHEFGKENGKLQTIGISYNNARWKTTTSLYEYTIRSSSTK